MTPIKSTDRDALNRAFAEKVAGWTLLPERPGLGGTTLRPQWEDHEGRAVFDELHFTDSADAVIPWLEKAGRWECDFIHDEAPMDRYMMKVADKTALATTFPLAAVRVLLRVAGVEVSDE